MTIEEVVGQMLVVGISGTRLRPEEAAHLRAIHAGGFIPFARNFESPEQFRALVAQLNEACGHELLVMVDQEGGRVVRFTTGVTYFQSPLSLGQTQTPEEAGQQGAMEAMELRALGVHVNLAPCVDVLVEGSDPVIGTRSYGSDPQRVSALAAGRIHGAQQAGLAMCAKHFPGLGAVPKDPHKHLPMLPLEWEAMRTVHLVPFRECIRAGVATIMSSHVCYPQLDPSGVPATFSHRLIHQLLRVELGFPGLILTDDMEMGALRDLCSIGEAAVRAVEAGHDVVLVCSDPAAQRAVFEALVAAIRSGRVSAEDLQRRTERIQRLRDFKQ